MSSSTMWPFDLDSRLNFKIHGQTVSHHQDSFIDSSIQIHKYAWISQSDQQCLIEAKDAKLTGANEDVIGTIGTAEKSIVAKSSFIITYPWHFLSIAEDIFIPLEEPTIKGSIHELAVIEGNITLGEGSKILPGVYIEGNVTIGENCKIGPNCYIRGNTSIGSDIHIGQSVEIKNSIISDNTNVGHLSYIGDTVVGKNANFGAGTIISNYRHDGENHKTMVADQLIDTGRRKFGAIVGDGVHTGINTSIYPGRKLQAHSTTKPCEIVNKDLAL